jgi:predicted amidophosphoribosyltransferase
MRPEALCPVCGRFATVLLCDQCRKSLDRMSKRDSTIWGVIVWAAKRARRFERSKR